MRCFCLCPVEVGDVAAAVKDDELAQDMLWRVGLAVDLAEESDKPLARTRA